MKVRLRNPDREVEVSGPRRVHDLLTQLEIDPDTVLVIRERTLLTRQERLDEGDLVEIRPSSRVGRAAAAPSPGARGAVSRR